MIMILGAFYALWPESSSGLIYSSVTWPYNIVRFHELPLTEMHQSTAGNGIDPQNQPGQYEHCFNMLVIAICQ